MRLSRLLGYGNLALAGGLMLVVWVLLVWVASRPAFKTLIDLTPQRRNSVDPVTEQLLADVRSNRIQVEFHTFFVPVTGQPQSEAEQQAMAIGARLRELTLLLLRRYAWLGGESVRVFEHDFYRDMDQVRELAPRFGITGNDDNVVVTVQMPGHERRHRTLSLAGDLGVIDAPGMRPGGGPPGAKVAVLKDYKGEEALSSAIKSLLLTGVPTAYVIDTYSEGLDLDNARIGGSYGQFFRALRDLGFKVLPLNLGTQRVVPPDATLVAVIEPRREFTEQDARALFDYVQRGGRLYLNYAYAGSEPDRNPDGGMLGRLLGFQVGRQPVFHLVPNLNNPSAPGIDGDPSVEKLNVALSPSHPVTRRLAAANRSIQVAAARPLQPLDAGAGVRREELVRTGPYAWLARFDATGRPSYQAPRTGLDYYPIGYAIEVDGQTPGGEGKPTTGQAIVISGIHCNNLGMVINADLALNICNWMAERRVLLDIQGSNYVAKYLEIGVPEIRNAWWLLVVVVPLVFLGTGGVVFWRRRRA